MRKTERFAEGLDGLTDPQARVRVLVRIERLAQGTPGEVEPVGEGVSELRVSYGPGYRVYFNSEGKRSLFCWLAATNAPKPGTSEPP